MQKEGPLIALLPSNYLALIITLLRTKTEEAPTSWLSTLESSTVHRFSLAHKQALWAELTLESWSIFVTHKLHIIFYFFCSASLILKFAARKMFPRVGSAPNWNKIQRRNGLFLLFISVVQICCANKRLLYKKCADNKMNTHLSLLSLLF